MDRIPILDVEEIEPLPENLSLMVFLDSQTLPCVQAPEPALQFEDNCSFFHIGAPSTFEISGPSRASAQQINFPSRRLAQARLP